LPTTTWRAKPGWPERANDWPQRANNPLRGRTLRYHPCLQTAGIATGNSEALSMPVDPSAYVHAILDGLSKIPPGILAAILLGGPTAIWLIIQFGNPPDGRKHEATAMDELLWVCTSCRSVNEDMRDRCYSCHRSRFGQEQAGVQAPGPTPLTAPRPWIAPGVGVAVGPGRPAQPQTSGSWLGSEAVGAGRPEIDPSAVAGERRTPVIAGPMPGAERAPAYDTDPGDPDDATAAAPDPRQLEPVILEPRVKVSGRRSAPPGGR
jgi:hypothetical protein